MSEAIDGSGAGAAAERSGSGGGAVPVNTGRFGSPGRDPVEAGRQRWRVNQGPEGETLRQLAERVAREEWTEEKLRKVAREDPPLYLKMLDALRKADSGAVAGDAGVPTEGVLAPSETELRLGGYCRMKLRELGRG